MRAYSDRRQTRVVTVVLDRSGGKSRLIALNAYQCPNRTKCQAMQRKFAPRGPGQSPAELGA